MGLSYVKGLGAAGSQRVVEARGQQPFRDLADLCRRTRLPRRLVENLILAGGLDAWRIPRRKLLWELDRLRYQTEALDFALVTDAVELPPLGEAGRLGQELSMTSVATGRHPLALYRDRLRQRGVLSVPDLDGCRDGQRVQVAGLLVMHQAPPTAKGFRFLTLEDEEELVNVIVKPQVYERYREVVRGSGLLVIEGRLQREPGIVNVVAERVSSLGV